MKPAAPVLAYVCADPGIPVFGNKGASVHVRAILFEAVRRGYDTHLFAARLGAPVPEALRGVRLHSLECPRGPAEEREQALIAADDALSAKLAGLREVAVIYQRYSLWSCSAIELAAERGWPSVLEINAPLLQEQAEHRELIDVASARERTVRAIRAASVPFAVSEPVARWATELSGRDVGVVANGVDPTRFAASQSSTAPGVPGEVTEVVVGFVGGFRPWHDVGSALEAVAAVNATMRGVRIRMLLVGDGPGLPAVLARAAELGVEVEATGSVPAGAVPALLAGMDVALALYPPGEHYFSPLKVFEYMAAGRAVLASRIEGLDEMFESGREIVLCEPGDFVGVVDRLRTLCGDATLRRRIGQAARRAVIEGHSWTAVFDRVIDRLPTPAGVS